MLLIFLYTAAAFDVVTWALRGPSVSSCKRVPRAGNILVDQFYAGLVLSIVLVPAAILVGLLGNEFVLIYPFDIYLHANLGLCNAVSVHGRERGQNRAALISRLSEAERAAGEQARAKPEQAGSRQVIIAETG